MSVTLNLSRELHFAERSRMAMERRLAKINAALPKLPNGEEISVFYQPSDGWVVLFGNKNATITPSELEHLVTLSPELATQYLEGKSV